MTTDSTPSEEQKAQVAEFEFSHAIGVAISTWQLVEQNLYLLFQILCRTDDGITPNAIYHAVRSFEVKIAMIDALIKARTSDATKLAAWTTLQKAIMRRKRIRDKLVHWTVVRSTVQNKFDGIYLTPAISDYRTIQRGDFLKPSSGAMQIGDVRQHAGAFNNIAKDLNQFATLNFPLTLPKK